MNRLNGTLTAIESNDLVSLVDVSVGHHVFTAILLETPASAAYLRVGQAVAVLFKETEVSLAKGLAGELTLRNRIKGGITAIRRGTILSEVSLTSPDGLTLTSIVTTRSVDRLTLARGDEVEALIKANEVSLMEIES